VPDHPPNVNSNDNDIVPANSSSALPTSVQVGWSLLDFPATVIWNDPLPYAYKGSVGKDQTNAPASSQEGARYFVITCPMDLHLRFAVDNNGRPVVQNIDGERSSVRDYFFNQMIQMTAPNEWRHPERPMLQIMTPYIFMADSPVYINQYPPFMDYVQPRLPGLLIDGRFPIDIWPRQLQWAFEWYDLKGEINIKRGDPWFYVYFETPDPCVDISLVESEITPEVKKYLNSINGVSNYVRQTYSLFSTARRRRPAKLVFPKEHYYYQG